MTTTRAPKALDATYHSEAGEAGASANAGPPSGVFRPRWHSDPPKSTNDNARQPLSQTLWGIDWNAHFPLPLGDSGIVGHVGEWDRVRDFVTAYAPQLVEVDGAHLSDRVRAAKVSYLRDHCDHFEFRVGDQTVGVVAGDPEDWSTYYFRVMVFDPARSVRNVMRRSFGAVVDVLREAGVQRARAETSPVNYPMASWLLKLGFHPTGHRVSDRWGNMVGFTLLVDPELRARFADNLTPRPLRCGGGKGEERREGT